MHSSRMSIVLCSCRPGWGEGVLPGRFACRREVCLPAGGGGGGGGVCLPVGVSACQGAVSAQGVVGQTPPRLWTEWQTRVKTLPCRNCTADGKNVLHEDVNRTIEIPQRTHCLNVHNVPFKLVFVNLVQRCVKIWRFMLSFTTSTFLCHKINYDVSVAKLPSTRDFKSFGGQVKHIRYVFLDDAFCLWRAKNTIVSVLQNLTVNVWNVVNSWFYVKSVNLKVLFFWQFGFAHFSWNWYILHISVILQVGNA